MQEASQRRITRYSMLVKTTNVHEELGLEEESAISVVSGPGDWRTSCFAFHQGLCIVRVMKRTIAHRHPSVDPFVATAGLSSCELDCLHLACCLSSYLASEGCRIHSL